MLTEIDATVKRAFFATALYSVEISSPCYLTYAKQRLIAFVGLGGGKTMVDGGQSGVALRDQIW